MKCLIVSCALAVSLVGCTSALQRADGSYDVPRSVEVRSPFGTNAGFVKLEHCLTKVSPWYWFADYTNCHRQKDWVATQSQGQGGQIASGAMIGAGIGIGAAASGATNTITSTASSVVTTVSKGHGHH